MGKMIEADELKDIVEYMCDEDGSEEAQKWCGWFIKVIQAQENKKDECEKDDNTIVSDINERQTMRITIKEAIEKVETAFEKWEDEYSIGDDWSEEHEALDITIKALEQKPILDKIIEIIEPLRHLSIDEMSDIERRILEVIGNENDD